MRTTSAIWTRRFAATARSSSLPMRQRTPSAPDPAARDDGQVGERPELGTVREGTARRADAVPESDAGDVDARAEKLPLRGRTRAVVGELPPRGDHAGSVARLRSDAMRIRQICIHVHAAR